MCILFDSLAFLFPESVISASCMKSVLSFLILTEFLFVVVFNTYWILVLSLARCCFLFFTLAEEKYDSLHVFINDCGSLIFHNH